MNNEKTREQLFRALAAVRNEIEKLREDESKLLKEITYAYKEVDRLREYKNIK